jgi:sarcosine oxidase
MPFDPMRDPGGIPDSYWAATAAPCAVSPALEGEAETEVAVIGAGFTGLSTALHLAQRGRRVTVLDAHEPGWGASGRNNGQVVAALKHEPHEMEAAFGKEVAARLIEQVGSGPDLVFSLIERYDIDCAARRRGILTAANTADSLDKLRRRTEVWQARGAPLRMLDKAEAQRAIGSDFYVGANLDPRGGSINPLGYARGLARAALQEGAAIHRDSHVRRITRAGEGWVVETPQARLHADRVVIATNAYTSDVWDELKRNFIPIRTPQVVSKPLGHNMRGTILPDGQIMSDTRHLVVGVRIHPDGRLHLGGATGTTGKERAGQFRVLQAQAARLFPHLPKLEWEYAWSGFIAMTPDRYPRLYDLAPGVASALGYSGRGIAMATLMGRELARWAAGEARIDDLVLPVSRQRALPYYDLRDIVVDGSIQYQRAKAAIGRLLRLDR